MGASIIINGTSPVSDSNPLPIKKEDEKREISNHEQDSTYDYWAFAPPGTALSASAWRVFRQPISLLGQTMYADGNSNYDNVGQNMSGLIYS